MENYSDEKIINVAGGEDVSIADLAQTVARTVGYTGALVSTLPKPDGMSRKALDDSAIRAIGWRPKISLTEGLERTYRGFWMAEICAGNRA